MPITRANDINIYYESHGEGDPVVLIQCLGANTIDWMLQTPVFSERYQVLIFDNRGAGRSDTTEPPYSAAMMADDTAALMNVLGINRAHMLGLSMGGFIAQEFAFRHPKRLQSLVLAATAAELPALAKHSMKAWLRMAKEDISLETRLIELFSWLFTGRLLENDQAVADMLRLFVSNPYPQSLPGYAGQIAACLRHDTRDRLAQINVPTLVLAGKEDILIPPKLSEELAAGIPKAELVVLEGGGHAFSGEIADQFNQTVLSFLGRVAQRK